MEETAITSGDKRSVGIKFGLIGTVVSIVYFVIMLVIGQNPLTFQWSWIFQIVMGAVMFYLAHKAYKEENNGFMTYGEGVTIGLWYTIVAMAIGFIFQYIYLNFIDTNLLKDFYDFQYAKMQEQGLGDDQIEMGLSWTRKLFWPMGIFFALLSSMILVLIVTIFTQKRPPEQRF